MRDAKGRELTTLRERIVNHRVRQLSSPTLGVQLEHARICGRMWRSRCTRRATCTQGCVARWMAASKLALCRDCARRTPHRSSLRRSRQPQLDQPPGHQRIVAAGLLKGQTSVMTWKVCFTLVIVMHDCDVALCSSCSECDVMGMTVSSRVFRHVRVR